MKTTYPTHSFGKDGFNQWEIYVSNECDKARQRELFRSKLKARLSKIQAMIERYNKRGNYLKSEYYQLLNEENELIKQIR